MSTNENSKLILAMSNAIQGTDAEEKNLTDNIAIALCTYFEDIADYEDSSEPIDEDYGWRKSSCEKVDNAFERASIEVLKAIEQTGFTVVRRDDADTYACAADENQCHAWGLYPHYQKCPNCSQNKLMKDIAQDIIFPKTPAEKARWMNELKALVCKAFPEWDGEAVCSFVEACTDLSYDDGYTAKEAFDLGCKA